MKKYICIFLSLVMISLVLVGCGKGEKKTVHCDRCGKEVEISADSQMNDDWTCFCSDCEKELGLDKVVPER